MVAIFIADAHLTGREDRNQTALIEFFSCLGQEEKTPGSLFLLGDLFEFWIGTNLVAWYEYGPVVDALKALSRRGWKIIYLEGNHDFFLDPVLAQELAMEIHPDSASIFLEGQRIFLAHGDTINSSDLGYRVLRFFLHNRSVRFLSDHLPPGLVWKIAFRLARLSRQHHYESEGNPLRSVFLDFARGKIREGFSYIILAHSHQPEILPLARGGQPVYYANPGDWAQSRSYLKWNSGSLELCRYK